MGFLVAEQVAKRVCHSFQPIDKLNILEIMRQIITVRKGANGFFYYTQPLHLALRFGFPLSRLRQTF
jgi:hypothetical protein